MNHKKEKKIFSINEIRNSWFEIFKENNYFYLDSFSLIPEEEDNSLLWINSGVAALKKFFNNPQIVSNKNIVNCQKVIRTDDLSNINSESYHQTLFEMLGSFSIGGNFKEEIIPIIWKWFISEKWLNLKSERIFVTVWKEDHVSLKIWEKLGVKKNNIVLGNKKTNFWDMGDGPCGSNTEIYYDINPEDKINPKKITDLENKRFIELCNIVFPEFYHKKKDYFVLEKKCVDVGAGLERICMIIQDKKNTFEIDVWNNVIELIKKEDKNYIVEEKGNYYIIIDHLRTVIFAISDGAEFRSKGRGYILKKLLKEVVLLSYFLNFSKEILIKLILKIIEINSTYYLNLEKEKEKIVKIISHKLDELIKFINNCNKILKKHTIYNAKELFFLYDTKGIPLKLIRFHLKEEEKHFPEEDFNNLLKEQKNKSKKNRKEKNVKVF